VGALVLACGGACTVVAYRVMIRIARLPDEQRVLR
jgi:tight adherence protein B